MKSRIILLTLLCILFVAGCSGDFAAGVLTGGTAVMVEANKTIDNLEEMNKEGVVILEEYKNNIEAAKDNPVLVAKIIDPNFGEALEEFIANAKKADDFDWKAVLAAFLVGGSGVNIFKNWRKG